MFNPFGIGDVLFTTPLIRNIKKNIPSARLSFMCNRRVKPILETNKFIEDIFVFEKDEYRAVLQKSKVSFLKKVFSLYKRIRNKKFDVIFDLSLNPQYSAFFKLAGIKKRIGFNFKNRGRFLTHKRDLPWGYKDMHVADYYLGLLEFISIKPEKLKFDLFLEEKNILKIQRIMKNLGISENDLLITICPGSGDSWQETAYFKRWPKENFTELCDMLSEELGAKIVLLGSDSEKFFCDFILANTKYRPINLCGRTSLLDLACLISISNLFITNDGGPFHISQSLGAKTIVLFGPTDEQVYGAYPREENCVVLKKDIRCRPCYKTFKFEGCKFDKKCLREINVKEVFEVARTSVVGFKG